MTNAYYVLCTIEVMCTYVSSLFVWNKNDYEQREKDLMKKYGFDRYMRKFSEIGKEFKTEIHHKKCAICKEKYEKTDEIFMVPSCG